MKVSAPRIMCSCGCSLINVSQGLGVDLSVGVFQQPVKMKNNYFVPLLSEKA